MVAKINYDDICKEVGVFSDFLENVRKRSKLVKFLTFRGATQK